MGWRGHNGQWCRVCDRHVSECGPLSARYKCVSCAARLQLENVRDMRSHSGPWFVNWIESMRAAFGVAIPGVDQPTEQEELEHARDL